MDFRSLVLLGDDFEPHLHPEIRMKLWPVTSISRSSQRICCNPKPLGLTPEQDPGWSIPKNGASQKHSNALHYSELNSDTPKVKY